MATNKPTNPLGTTPYLFYTGTLATSAQADASKMTSGWNTAGEKPKRNHQNGLFKYLTQFMQHVNDYGIPHWDTDSSYLAGSWARSTVDNKVYVCILDADNTRGEPSVTATYWMTLESSLIPAGKVEYFAMASAPSGYLKANGAAVSRTTYARLFTAIGTVYGVGDGSTTFNLPDLRGEFLRGWDDGRGVDAARAIGTAQAADIANHGHSFITGTGNSNTDPTGGIAMDNNGTIAVQSAFTGTPTAIPSQLIGGSGGTETRPRNIALLACIKF